MNNPILDRYVWRTEPRGIRGGRFYSFTPALITHRDGMKRNWEVRYIGFRVVRNGQ